MDPRRLLTFRTVAHERSFSRAAERLSRSQPSVSSQVALLETEVGVRLFERGRRGLRLTRAGEVLLEHADHVAWRLDLADTQIAALADARRAEVRLGAFPTALAGLVPAATTALKAARPDARVRLIEVRPSALEPRLLSGEFDLALSYQDASAERREIKGVERLDLMQETFFVALPPGHPLAQDDGPLALTELAGDDWILPSTEGFLIDACREAGFEPRIVAISQETVSTRGMIQRGLGVGWVPSLLAEEYREVVVRPVDGPMRRRDIYALLPPGERQHNVNDVVAALREAARAFDVRTV
ncbi:MAG: LysR family transcriptional regulator [Actinomycetota bacterium]|nr:LysR family transcriptional regulator [Actinomycetota bacterium]MDQ5807545.1 LysR family transcriptional regulator [Actinomycetota bacterium]